MKKLKTKRDITEKQKANLVPFSTLPASTHKAISAKGGKASGEARRKKRELINQEKAKAIAEDELRAESLQFIKAEVKELKRLSQIYR